MGILLKSHTPLINDMAVIYCESQTTFYALSENHGQEITVITLIRSNIRT